MRVYIGIAVVCLLLGAALEFKLNPPKTVTNTVTQEVTKTDVVTVVKEIKKPDGTVETDTTTTDKTIVDTDTKTQTTVLQSKQWTVYLQIVPHTQDWTRPNYEIGAYKKWLGDLSVGGSYRTDGTVGLGLLYSF